MLKVNRQVVSVGPTMRLPLGTTLLTLQGHRGEIWNIAWSPDSKRLATASWDHTVQVWDATSGQHLLTYRGHTDLVLAVAWSPDGKRLTYRGHPKRVWAVAWSPDGTRLASGGEEGTVQVWDASTGHSILIYRGHTDIVLALAWSPDGTQIASASVDVFVWQAS